MTRITISDNGNHIVIGLLGDGGFSVSLSHGDDAVELQISKEHMNAVYQAMSHLMNAQSELSHQGQWEDMQTRARSG